MFGEIKGVGDEVGKMVGERDGLIERVGVGRLEEGGLELKLNKMRKSSRKRFNDSAGSDCDIVGDCAVTFFGISRENVGKVRKKSNITELTMMKNFFIMVSWLDSLIL